MRGIGIFCTEESNPCKWNIVSIACVRRGRKMPFQICCFIDADTPVSSEEQCRVDDSQSAGIENAEGAAV
jgi:hypothetical protein